jgi:hypothetical protein
MLHVVFVVNGFQDLVITGLERERRKPARSFNKMKLFWIITDFEGGRSQGFSAKLRITPDRFGKCRGGERAKLGISGGLVQDLIVDYQ